MTIDKIVIYDIETMLEFFLYGCYVPEEPQYYEFSINKWGNTLDGMLKFLERHEDYYFVSFNGLRFDAQVIEWMIHNYDNWIDLGNLEITRRIWQKAQDIIDDANYDIFPDYKEEKLSFKQIDLFTIWHFNNENRRTSLKTVEYAIDFENIEEMPIPHNKKELTPEEIVLTSDYCKNDVMATYELYKITRGKTELTLYKGEDKIADRVTMMEEFEIPCLNWDDVKIGAEWNKLDYIKLTNKDEKELKPTKINTFYGKKFKQFFPETVSFKTKPLQDFIRTLGNTYILNKKQEFRYKFNDELTATVAKGGVHSNEGGRFIRLPDELYYQVDIGSQYPNAIRKYKVEPKHLPGWNSLIVNKISRRLEYKRLSKNTGNPKYESLQKMGKLALNGGSYGRLNTRGDWQEDPCCMLQVTMGGQLEILMIVETLILKGFRVVSLNTDGFDAIIPKDRDKEFHSILSDFEIIIGNDVLGQFEYTEFLWIAQTSVNDYIALKKDGTYKMKGDFEVDKEIHKNKSGRIIPIALKEYYVNGIPVEETIKKHTNIYDFCLRQKSSKDFHYEGTNRKTGKTTIYNKLIRYYVSNSGEKLYKIKNPECTTNAPKASQIEAGEWMITTCNYLPKETKVADCDLNYQYYVDRCERIISKIEGKKKTKTIVGQLNLF